MDFVGCAALAAAAAAATYCVITSPMLSRGGRPYTLWPVCRQQAVMLPPPLQLLYPAVCIYHADRVMTVSFHKYDGEFFPGTGDLDEVSHLLCCMVSLLLQSHFVSSLAMCAAVAAGLGDRCIKPCTHVSTDICGAACYY